MKNIKAIIWDIDGTLYQSIPRLSQAIHEDALVKIEKKLGVDKDKAAEILETNYKRLSSTTKVLLKMGFSWQEAVERLKHCFYLKTQFIKKDPKLVLMFKKLSHYRHFIASNNPEELCQRLLETLGLNPEIFEKIFGNEQNTIKPDLKFFQRILDYTGFPADQHLFVGDREKTEIIPAKRLGMKTCFVWHVKSPKATTCLTARSRKAQAPRDFAGWGKSKAADVSISKIYDIVKVV